MPRRSPCQGTQASLPTPGQCPDPGTVTQGGNVLVADTNFCPKRLLPIRDGSGNIIGAMLSDLGAGTPNSNIQFTNQPGVLYPPLSPVSGQAFGALIISSGANGLHFRVLPPAVADLFLQTDGAGNVEFGPPPVATIPNPLDAVVLNVSGATTLAGLATLNGGIALAGVPTGTIANLLGFNSAGAVVSSTSSSPAAAINKALFYEDTSFTAQNFPNRTIAPGGAAVIGNQLYSADGIAVISASNTIKVTAAGTYQIDWMGCFGAATIGGTAGTFGLQLYSPTNAGIAAVGMQGATAGYQSSPGSIWQGSTVAGSWMGPVNLDDTLQIIATAPSYSGGLPSATPAALQLRNVTVILTKFH
jgi:hypothetical protein